MEDEEHHSHRYHQRQADDEDHLQAGEGALGPLPTHGGGTVEAERSQWGRQADRTDPVLGTSHSEQHTVPSESWRWFCVLCPSGEQAEVVRMGNGGLFFNLLKTAKVYLCEQRSLPITRPDKTGWLAKLPVLHFSEQFACSFEDTFYINPLIFHQTLHSLSSQRRCCSLKPHSFSDAPTLRAHPKTILSPKYVTIRSI